MQLLGTSNGKMKVYEATLQYNKTLFEVSTKVINTPERAYEYLKDIVDDYPYQESCWVLLLNNKSHALFRIMITKGTLTSSLISPREVFTPALISGAASVILAHNHPSGDPAPSSADLNVTRICREAGTILGIAVVDHIILGHKEMDPLGKGWYSFREAGIL
jgi:DNA repair protein RadC